MLKQEEIQAQVLACLLDHPDGADPVTLVNHLSRFFTTTEIDEHLQTVLQDQLSQSRLYQQGDASRWHLTARCRKQMEDELPKFEQRLKAIDEQPGEN